MTKSEADRGRYLGYIRLVGHRQGQVKLETYCWPDNLRIPPQYTKKPLLRSQDSRNGVYDVAYHENVP
jgi:hypothetical protein